MALYNHLLGKGLAVVGLPLRYKKHFNYDSIFSKIYYFYLSHTTYK